MSHYLEKLISLRSMVSFPSLVWHGKGSKLSLGHLWVPKFNLETSR